MWVFIVAVSLVVTSVNSLVVTPGEDVLQTVTIEWAEDKVSDQDKVSIYHCDQIEYFHEGDTCRNATNLTKLYSRWTHRKADPSLFPNGEYEFSVGGMNSVDITVDDVGSYRVDYTSKSLVLKTELFNVGPPAGPGFVRTLGDTIFDDIVFEYHLDNQTAHIGDKLDILTNGTQMCSLIPGELNNKQNIWETGEQYSCAFQFSSVNEMWPTKLFSYGYWKTTFHQGGVFEFVTFDYFNSSEPRRLVGEGKVCKTKFQPSEMIVIEAGTELPINGTIDRETGTTTCPETYIERMKTEAEELTHGSPRLEVATEQAEWKPKMLRNLPVVAYSKFIGSRKLSVNVREDLTISVPIKAKYSVITKAIKSHLELHRFEMEVIASGVSASTSGYILGHFPKSQINVGTEYTARIDSYDVHGNQITTKVEGFTSWLARSDGSKLKDIQVTYELNGVYSMQYSAKERGIYYMYTQHQGENVQGSPYLIEVVDPTLCSPEDYVTTITECDPSNSNPTRAVEFRWRSPDVLCSTTQKLPENLYFDCASVPVRAGMTTFIKILSLVCAGLCLSTQAVLIRFWRTPVIKFSQPMSLSGYVLSAACFCLSPFLYITNPESCVFNQAYFNITFTLMFAFLATKLHRLYMIFTNCLQLQVNKTKNMGMAYVMKHVAYILTVEITIQILWATIDPSSVQDVTIGRVSATNTQVLDRACVSPTTTFSLLSGIYKIVLTICTTFMAYILKSNSGFANLHESVDESSALYTASFAILVVGGITSAVVFTNIVRPSTGFYFQSLSLLLLTCGTVLIILVPKFRNVHLNRASVISTQGSVTTTSRTSSRISSAKSHRPGINSTKSRV